MDPKEKDKSTTTEKDPALKTTAAQTDPAPKPAKFDDKGHLPLTDVPNKGETHVHAGQIEDKGTAVLQTKQELPMQEGASAAIVKAAKPTGSDDRAARAIVAPVVAPKEKEKEKKEEKPLRPEELAAMQVENENAKYSDMVEKTSKMHGDQLDNPVKENRQGGGLRTGTVVKAAPVRKSKQGDDTRFTSLAGVGSPLQMTANHLPGDKVLDIYPDGSHWLKVQTQDKSRAFHIDGCDKDEKIKLLTKMKVEVRFPAINAAVSQRHLLIMITDATEPKEEEKEKKPEGKEKKPEGKEKKEYSPCEIFFPPDVSHVHVLLPLNCCIHMEMTHLDKEGHGTNPYMVDFYTNHLVTPIPLEASPIGIELMTNTLVCDD